MKILLLFALLGVCLATPVPQPQGPQWPYDNSPYYYGHPGITKYVYRASIEDDEEPLDRSRQDQGQSVTALINNAALKQQESINNYGNEKQTSVVETGSVAPVPERPGEASSSVANSGAASNSKVPSGAQPPSIVKPGVVNPPAFPPKRVPRPPTKKPAEEEDSDEEDEDDDEDSAQDEDDDEDEEEEEERRRNEPIDAPEPAVVPVPENATSVENVDIASPVAVESAKPEKPDVVSTDAENSVEAPQDEESSDENSSYEGVEAFVPGYVTDQGEVLVPVDTVTGDQPISIVPDPYTPPARGVPLNYYNYNRGLAGNGLPYPVAPAVAATPSRVFRQGDIDGDDDDDVEAEDEVSVEDEEEGADDDEDEEEEEEDDADTETKKKTKKQPKVNKRPPLAFIPATAPTNEDDELESALRYRSEAFPASRSPVLLPVTFRFNGGYLTGPFKRPVTSAEVFQFVDPQIKYVAQRRTQPSTPAMNPFAPYMAGNQYESQIVLRKPVSMPTTYTTGYRRPVSRPVSRVPVSMPYYVKSAEGGSEYYPMMQYPGVMSHPPKLHNPGEKLKIKSSYELLVEPPTDVVKYKTKSKPIKKKRPNNKRRPVPPVVLKTKVRPTTVVVPKKPVVLSRPVYNVQPQTRVPVRPVAPYYVSAPYRPSPYYSPVSEFGGPRYPMVGYGGFRPLRNPTPVIYQDEPGSESSASDEAVPEERRPKWKREMKKPQATSKKLKKSNKQTDRLGLFSSKAVLKKKTGRA